MTWPELPRNLMDIQKPLEQIAATPGLERLRPVVAAKLAEKYLSLSAHVTFVEENLDQWQSNPKAERKVTRERVLQKLDFDRATGEFTWKETHRRGQIAGAVSRERGKAYRRIRLDDELIMAHALVWLVIYHEFPVFEIDHTNGNGIDNRPENLEKSNRLKNNSNTGLRSDAAQHRCVGRNGRYWQTLVKYAKREFYVSGFESGEEAAIARDFLEQLLPRGAKHGK